MDEKWQQIRNTIYGIGGAVIAVLATLGFINQVGSAEGMTLLNAALDLVGNAIGLGLAVLAWWKSRKSKVATLSTPAMLIESYTTKDGKVIAGPGNSLPTGTVISAPTSPIPPEQQAVA